jgi:2-polyprenyl-6-methoxyphenol hydroxylase-like FAD-dependent oxidoreductase
MSDFRRLKVAIIGCGTAGPAAAILLKRQSHEVILFERAAECKAVGAGFLLQPSGMAVMDELGISAQVLAHAARVEGLHVLDVNGDSLLKLDYRELGHGTFGAGLHRPVLLHFLLEEITRVGLEMRWGCEITQLFRAGDHWTLAAKTGEEWHGMDLVIVADGARSKLRDLVCSTGVDRGYPWGAHWFIGTNDGAFPENELYQVVNGTQRLCGFLATGRELGGTEPLVSLFWSIKISDDAAWRQRPIADWKAEVLDHCPRAAGLLDQITSWEQVLTARYGDVRMSCWYSAGIVVLGDAAHAMSPQLGQGVNLALADASCLAECLAAYPLAQALPAYQKRRRIALGYYALATRWLTPWFQSDYEWLSPVRKGFFFVAQHLRTARFLMTWTMAGMAASRVKKTNLSND